MIHNGEVWESPSYMRAVTQWLDGDQWMLLRTPLPATHGGTCMVAMTEKDGRVFLTQNELEDRLQRGGWKLTDLQLIYESKPGE